MAKDRREKPQGQRIANHLDVSFLFDHADCNQRNKSTGFVLKDKMYFERRTKASGAIQVPSSILISIFADY